MLKKPPAERLKLLRESKQPAGAVPVGDPARQLPLRRGAPGRRSPTARATSTSRCAGASAASRARSSSGRQAGWKQVAQWVKEDIDAGKALSSAPLPAWVFDGPARRRRRAHGRRLVERRARSASSPRSTLPVYQRQLFRETRRRQRRRRRSKSRHRGLPERRGARLDARRRGADRQHHRQAAPDQPGGDRRPAEGGRARRERATRAS